MVADCVDGFRIYSELARTNGVNIGVIMLDWPWGVMKGAGNEWDIHFSDEKINELFSAISNTAPNALVVIFDDVHKIGHIQDLAMNIFQTVIPMTWYKPNTPQCAFSKVTYCANTFLYCSMNPLTWVSMNDTSLKEIIPQENSIVCSNFVCCPGVTSKAKNDDGDIINETEKPIELLRGILYNHCRGSDVVVDLCSGSGSATIAAASLRKTCWSVDNRADQVEAARQRLRKYDLSTVYRHPQDIFFIEKMLEKKAKPKSSTGKRKKSETPAKATPAKKMKKNRSSSTSPERFKKKTKRTRRTSKNAVASSQPIPRLNIEPSASTVDDIAFPDISTPATVVSSTAVELGLKP